jgi:amino acid transporter
MLNLNKINTQKLFNHMFASASKYGGLLIGGTFSILGFALQFAGDRAPTAFLVAGGMVLIAAKSTSQLGGNHLSQDGIPTFLDSVLEKDITARILNILAWLSYVLLISLYARTFGDYGAAFLPSSLQPVWVHILASAVLIAVTGIILMDATSVPRIEKWLILPTFGLLILFAAFGLRNIHSRTIETVAGESSLKPLIGGIVVYFVFQGFELFIDSSKVPKIKESSPTIFIFLTLGFMVILCAAVAFAAVVNLSKGTIRNYALAQIAGAYWGPNGFFLVAFAALVATFFAIYRTLGGIDHIGANFSIADSQSSRVMRNLSYESFERLFATIMLSIFLANLLDLESIAILGSAGFLLVQIIINTSNFLPHQKQGKSRLISGIFVVLFTSALIVLIRYLVQHLFPQFLLLCLMLILVVLTEFFIHSRTKGKIVKTDEISNSRMD